MLTKVFSVGGFLESFGNVSFSLNKIKIITINPQIAVNVNGALQLYQDVKNPPKKGAIIGPIAIAIARKAIAFAASIPSVVSLIIARHITSVEHAPVA